MRVLLLSADPGIPLYGPSGASAHLRGVARALLRRGDDVRIAVPREADDRGRVEDPVDAPVITSPPRRWGWLPRTIRDRGGGWDSRRLVAAALADGWVPDLVWERHAVGADGGKRLGQGRITGAPVRRVVELNAPCAAERIAGGAPESPFLADLERANLTQGVWRVAAVSPWLTRWATAFGAPARWVPNGSEVVPVDRRVARRGLAVDGLVVGLVASMKPWHGIERLPALAEALPDATFVVVGDGPVAIPPHPRIRALGRIAPAALSAVIGAFDVGLHAAPGGGPPWTAPLKLVDYATAGVPWVAVDGPATRDAVGGLRCADTIPALSTAIRAAAALPRTPRPRPWDQVVAEALTPGPGGSPG